MVYKGIIYCSLCLEEQELEERHNLYWHIGTSSDEGISQALDERHEACLYSGDKEEFIYGNFRWWKDE